MEKPTRTKKLLTEPVVKLARLDYNYSNGQLIIKSQVHLERLEQIQFKRKLRPSKTPRSNNTPLLPTRPPSRDRRSSLNSSPTSSGYSSLKSRGSSVQKHHLKLLSKPKKRVISSNHYEVERIVDFRMDGTEPLFEIKWKKWPSKYNTWEPLDNLDSCPERLLEFMRYHFVNEFQTVRDELIPADLLTKESLERLMREPGSLNPPAELDVQKDLLKLVYMPAEHPDAELTRTRVIRSLRMRELHKKRREQLEALAIWQAEINASTFESATITVENNIDLEGPTSEFHYVNQCLPGPGTVLPTGPLAAGCECDEGMCATRGNKQCCVERSEGACYYKSNQIKVVPGVPIYECNSRCRCDARCPNRVVQQGRKYALSIFRTDNGRGWGVKALQRIPFGRFVCEYVGEIVTCEEAERRGRTYDAVGRTYLFDLDYCSNDNPFTVDASSFGNIARFINHSCEPNAAVWAVWDEIEDLNVPRLAIFATDVIDKGEEITFDYMCQNNPEQVDEVTDGRKFKRNGSKLDLPESKSDSLAPRYQCRCGSAKCRRYLF